MGRDISHVTLDVPFQRFNPRARMGRDKSIEADMAAQAGFNPRARMGRDRDDTHVRRRKARFNPRARMGRDPTRHIGPGRRFVSIHAPAWGATFHCSPFLLPARFQSTRPHGARLGNVTRPVDCGVFQSTRPHGARPSGNLIL